MRKKIELVAEKFVHGGQCIARRDDGKAVFIWNALPGEKVIAEIVREKKDFAEAIAIEILEPSKDRVEPVDPHFLASAPWQILDPKVENQIKAEIAAETYSKIGDLIISADQIEVATDGKIEGYRNKMEYSFTHKDADNNEKVFQAQKENPPKRFEDAKTVEDVGVHEEIALSLFNRGGKGKVIVNSSSIADPLIDEVAGKVLFWINEEKIPLRTLKSLIIRTNTNEESDEVYAIAALFIKDKITFDRYPELSEKLKGFQLYFSTHRSPIAVPTEKLYSNGLENLETKILGTPLMYSALSFFQVNIPVFTLALKDIAAFLDPKAPLVDFYSGVGAIGLPLSMNRNETVLVETNEDACAYAKKNIELGNLKNCQAICSPAEKVTEYITGEKAIVVDPPRAGLHQDVVSSLLKAAPPRIVYLSCNLSTQARDMRMLSSRYKPVFIKLYNFFPRTPHIEGLVVLEKVQ